MGDIYCAVCGEPWESYGVNHGDMTPEERIIFLDGKGCPCCKGERPEGINQEEACNRFLSSLFDNVE